MEERMSPPDLPGFLTGSVAEEIWGLLAYLSIQLREHFERAAAEFGLTPPQAHLLLQLAPGEEISQREVSRRLHCAPSSVVDHTDRLEARGLLERRVSRTDRRVNALVTTEHGEEIRARLTARLYTPLPTIQRLSAANQRLVRDLLRDLLRELSAGEESASVQAAL
jgi:DNA-binding MarR family transcriptional regulator